MCCCGPDEEGVTVTLDRFDPGRDQPGASGRVPSALLPGDILVPCLFSTQTEMSSDAVVQSESDLHHCFKVSLTPAAACLRLSFKCRLKDQTSVFHSVISLCWAWTGVLKCYTCCIQEMLAEWKNKQTRSCSHIIH